MAKPSKLPEWDTTQVNSIEPDSAHKDEGWLAPGGVPEKPPFQTFNYWQNEVYRWLDALNISGILEYDALTDYIASESYVIGSNGNLYICWVNNGPATAVVDPVGDATGAWSLFETNIYRIDASETDQGVAGNGRTIKAFVDLIGTSKKATLILTHNGIANTTAYTLTTSETIPDNITLKKETGAIIDGAGTLTLDCPEQISANLNQQIFGSSIIISFINPGIVYAEWWGIDGTADNVQINSAITSLPATGGLVQLLGKIYSLNDTGSNQAINMDTGIILKGLGIGATVLKVANSQDAHAIDINTKTDIKICDLAIDGNRGNQTAGVHGIRGTSVSRLVIENVYIHDCFTYGIGLQSGTFNDIFIDKIVIDSTGADGIDIKNTNDNSSNLVLTNIRVKNHGLNNALGAGQAGLDIRGQCHLDNITVTNYGTNTNDVIGIRLRTGETGSPTGLGAHKSTLNNFYIKAASNSGTYGLEHNARYCTISNGYVEGNEWNYRFTQRENALSNLIAFAGVNGFHFKNAGDFTDPDRNMCSCLIARENTGDGFIVESDENVFTSIEARSCTSEGVRVDAGATSNHFIGGQITGNGTQFTDNGTSTIIKHILGVITERSNTSSISSGSTSVIVSHGLIFTPAVQNISIIGMENPTNTIGAIWVDTITATQFTVNVENDPGASNWSFGWRAAVTA